MTITVTLYKPKPGEISELPVTVWIDGVPHDGAFQTEQMNGDADEITTEVTPRA